MKLTFSCMLGAVASQFIDNHGDFIVSKDNVMQLAKLSSNVYLNNVMSGYQTNFTNYTDLSIDKNSVKAVLFTGVPDVDVIAIKGTSMFDLYSCPNSIQFNYLSHHANDKYNDNLFFSCCKLPFDCQCNSTLCTSCKNCYKKSLNFEINYIKLLHTIVKNYMHNNKKPVIFTGHSLGGGLAAILANMYNKIAVSFQSPGDAHYIEMTDLPKNDQHVYHFGHDADPIFTGNCGSTCSLFGYNIETKSHTGKTCNYPAQQKLGIRESIWNHKIQYIINNIIVHWDTDMPTCSRVECQDCIA
ncbi:hypothetical protein EB118_15325 [bacterium]|nr:hypothetical protein [bacterium]NDD84239.1 hypothetical protein [bacterium]NDG31424.1 hypothetical protein [bacterium]